jgi:DNA-directed RNA polymerase subunit RPC12/RpoP
MIQKELSCTDCKNKINLKSKSTINMLVVTGFSILIFTFVGSNISLTGLPFMIDGSILFGIIGIPMGIVVSRMFIKCPNCGKVQSCMEE